jgi:hypothetical protein
VHELGHAVIDQHQSIPAALGFVKIDWLAEGISVAKGQQSSYMSRSEVLAPAAGQPLGPVILLAATGDPSRWRSRFEEIFDCPLVTMSRRFSKR